MQLPKFTRREFCIQSVQAASLAAVATAITGCGGSSPTSATATFPALTRVSATASGNTTTVTIAAGSPLATVGGAALVQSNRNFLVARTGQDTFTALTDVCTHEQCGVTNYSSGTYECPCHGSRYSTTGAVVRGPATRSLQQFNTSFSNNVLTITV